jgi:hypothetical protein
MTKFRAYTVLESDNHVPDDITEALGLPAHVHHARLLVFAESREAAWRWMKLLDIVPDRAGQIVLAVGDDVDVLVTAGVAHNHNAFALRPNTETGPIVKIVPALEDKPRVLHVIGELCRAYGKLHWHAAKNMIVVTDAMVQAALNDFGYGDIDPEDMRAAIYAALQAREK